MMHLCKNSIPYHLAHYITIFYLELVGEYQITNAIQGGI